MKQRIMSVQLFLVVMMLSSILYASDQGDANRKPQMFGPDQEVFVYLDDTKKVYTMYIPKEGALWSDVQKILAEQLDVPWESIVFKFAGKIGDPNKPLPKNWFVEHFQLHARINIIGSPAELLEFITDPEEQVSFNSYLTRYYQSGIGYFDKKERLKQAIKGITTFIETPEDVKRKLIAALNNDFVKMYGLPDQTIKISVEQPAAKNSTIIDVPSKGMVWSDVRKFIAQAMTIPDSWIYIDVNGKPISDYSEAVPDLSKVALSIVVDRVERNLNMAPAFIPTSGKIGPKRAAERNN